jgi:allantoin racemase
MIPTRMRLLVVNANTSESVTRFLAETARAVASDGTEIIAVTAAFGAAVIQSQADHEVAQRACLDAVRRNAGKYDAVLVAVSLDTAVEELQDICTGPVVGMTGAALTFAAEQGAAIGVLTMGETMKAMFLERFGNQRAAALHSVNLSPVGAVQDREGAMRLLEQGVAELANQGMDVAVLMGATVAGLARPLRQTSKIPVLDGVECGVLLAERLVREGASRSHTIPKTSISACKKEPSQ